MKNTIWGTLILLLALACSGGQAPDDISATGTWRGETVLDTLPVAVETRLVDRNGEVRGSGTFGIAGQAFEFTADGIRDGETLFLDIVVQAYYPVTASGQVYLDSLILELNGSGFNRDAAILRRIAP